MPAKLAACEALDRIKLADCKGRGPVCNGLQWGAQSSYAVVCATQRTEQKIGKIAPMHFQRLREGVPGTRIAFADIHAGVRSEERSYRDCAAGASAPDGAAQRRNPGSLQYLYSSDSHSLSVSRAKPSLW